MVVQTERDNMATSGEEETPPATTETNSPQPSQIGSPDPVERIQSPMADDNCESTAPELEDTNNEMEATIELPMTPQLEDEMIATDEMIMDVIEKLENEMAPADEIPVIEDDADEPDQTSEAVTEIATDVIPPVVKDETIDKASIERPKPMEPETSGCNKAQQAINNVKESAHQAVEAFGNKVAKFFGSMRKVKSLLHINEADEKGKEDDQKALSSSTGNLNKITDSIKSRACTIL